MIEKNASKEIATTYKYFKENETSTDELKILDYAYDTFEENLFTNFIKNIQKGSTCKESIVELAKSRNDTNFSESYAMTLSAEQLCSLVDEGADLKYPDFGGVKPEKIRSLDNFNAQTFQDNGKDINDYVKTNENGEQILSLSRVGDLNGKSLAIDEITGPSTLSERSIINSSDAYFSTMEFNYTKYKKLMDAIVSGEPITPAKLKSITGANLTQERIDEIISNYQDRGYKRSHTARGVYDLQNNGANINADYGFFGIAEAWEAAGTSGGAFQITTAFSIKLMEELGIVSKISYGENGELGTIADYDNTHAKKIGIGN